ncbi:hypothetical protein [Parasitella parasitica]|uniref:LIM zinc-binding domain-containing protein n=1 Tax=Parasitella parasitica TaxID=35722 RepID=A0A0B7NEV6_9FUNG|nr:hypothetical protein [Parasitella parasitica]
MPPRFGGAPRCPRCEKCTLISWLDSTTLTEKDNEAYCKTCYGRKWGPKGYGFAGGAAFLSTENKMPSEILKENFESDTFRATPTAVVPSLPSRESPSLPPRPQATVAPTTLSARATPTLPSRPTNNDKKTAEQVSTTPYIKNHTGYVPRKLNFQAQQDICTGCGKVVYAAELALGAGNKYHKMCLKCCQCGKKLDSTNMTDRDFDLYCRGCYSKSFGPKGYGYGNLLTPEGATR